MQSPFRNHILYFIVQNYFASWFLLLVLMVFQASFQFRSEFFSLTQNAKRSHESKHFEFRILQGTWLSIFSIYSHQPFAHNNTKYRELLIVDINITKFKIISLIVLSYLTSVAFFRVWLLHMLALRPRSLWKFLSQIYLLWYFGTFSRVIKGSRSMYLYISLENVIMLKNQFSTNPSNFGAKRALSIYFYYIQLSRLKSEHFVWVNDRRKKMPGK